MKKFKDFISEGLRDAMKPKDKVDIIEALSNTNVDLNTFDNNFIYSVMEFFSQIELDVSKFKFIDASEESDGPSRRAFSMIYHMINFRKLEATESGDGDVFCRYYIDPEILMFDRNDGVSCIAYKESDAIKNINAGKLIEMLKRN